MILSSRNKISRCRPILGTFVQIDVLDEDKFRAHQAINRAFASIEHIHQLMSFHSHLSEVSRLNQWANHEDVKVSVETYRVLEFSKELFRRSQGIFDITVADELMRLNILPSHHFLEDFKESSGKSCDILLLPQEKVRFTKPLCIDLGGVAKGFAVDRAVEILCNEGISNAIVNAGGDLRCFGEEEHAVHVRHPSTAQITLPLLPSFRNLALASSANSYGTEDSCPHLHGISKAPIRRPFSVSICANSCMTADALTKIVLALESESVDILNQYGAHAYLLYPDNSIISIGLENI